jgi:hypothetical protein
MAPSRHRSAKVVVVENHQEWEPPMLMATKRLKRPREPLWYGRHVRVSGSDDLLLYGVYFGQAEGVTYIGFDFEALNPSKFRGRAVGFNPNQVRIVAFDWHKASSLSVSWETAREAFPDLVESPAPPRAISVGGD